MAEALFGDTNPGGRLPVTFYKSVDDLPPFEDYAMEGRTYRYFDGEVLYPFGYGLSYTRFDIADLALNFDRMEGPETLEIAFRVRNIGKVTGDEVVQVYIRDERSVCACAASQPGCFQAGAPGSRRGDEGVASGRSAGFCLCE